MKMKTSRWEIPSPALPPAFDGYTIAHVTDLHNRDFGTLLIERLAAERPDCIVVTGDSIHREGQTEHAEKFALGAVQIAPVYYVTGNHEKVLSCYPAFSQSLRDMGVRVLENAYQIVRRGDEKIALLGMHDPAFFAGGKSEFVQTLGDLHAQIRDENVPYTVLLSHRPELFLRYVAEDIQLTLCGHAHGGHVRLPLIGAFYAPNQGLFPKYTEGVYEKDGCRMAVSKGLGKSSWVPRVFNPPELCVEILRHTQIKTKTEGETPEPQKETYESQKSDVPEGENAATQENGDFGEELAAAREKEEQ